MRDKFLYEKEWKCQMLYPLERFIGQHKGAYTVIKESAEHVPFQIPINFTRVGFLLATIASSDAGLQVAMANIKSDAASTSATSKRHHFKLAATYLQSFCTILKKFLTGTKHDAIKISDTTAFGKSGVSLRYYSAKEYEALTQSQKDSFQEWCNKSKPVQQRKAQGHGRGQGGKGESPSSK
eukprot:7889307-Ditylum_brightwellii.AAC.3